MSRGEETESTNPPSAHHQSDEQYGVDSDLLASETQPDHIRILEAWQNLNSDERHAAFRELPRIEAEELFLGLKSADQAEMLDILTPLERRSWIRLLPPDDAADLIQELPEEARTDALDLLDYQTRKEVLALLAYAEDKAGGLMNSRFVRLRPEMSVDEAIRYLRAQARGEVETIYYAYVLDFDQKLLGVVSFRDLFAASPEKKVQDIMETDIVTIPEDMDQEQVGILFSQHDLAAIPVVDGEYRMKGIVTADDIFEVFQEEATEDIHKIGGSEALDAPYLKTSFFSLLKKRAGWLTVLFVGQMFTAAVMSHYENEIQAAVVLALFIPLIISSGGNSGSQASTLIIRAIALGEIRNRDWWRVLLREIYSGIALGLTLGLIGMLSIFVQPGRATTFGEHYPQVALTVCFSVIFVVLWGTTFGSMLPFILKKLRFDPAAASAPLISTVCDVTGLVIYFSVASVLLSTIL